MTAHRILVVSVVERLPRKRWRKLRREALSLGVELRTSSLVPPNTGYLFRGDLLEPKLMPIRVDHKM